MSLYMNIFVAPDRRTNIMKCFCTEMDTLMRNISFNNNSVGGENNTSLCSSTECHQYTWLKHDQAWFTACCWLGNLFTILDSSCSSCHTAQPLFFSFFRWFPKEFKSDSFLALILIYMRKLYCETLQTLHNVSKSGLFWVCTICYLATKHLSWLVIWHCILECYSLIYSIIQKKTTSSSSEELQKFK